MYPTRAAAAATSLILTLGVAMTGCAASSDSREPMAAASDNAVTHASNDRVPEGAAWTQHYFPSSDGSDVELHADVLLPEHHRDGAKLPVILAAGPYFGHSGEQKVEDWAHTGPSDRFRDLIDEGKALERGYALVLVDLRGFGGSTGCLDFGGRGDQADVKAAIDWAAQQPWSSGAVGMYGKSFDALTGLIGNNLNDPALKAVVAQEPIWDLYRNTRSNGVPRTTIVAASGTYNTIAAQPQLPDDDQHYRDNAAYDTAHPECAIQNAADYQIADPDSDYWRTRNLAAQAKGTTTPLFVTQGFLEWNTEAEAMQEFLDNHSGPERGWLGQWDHRRGNERVADNQLAMGRDGWLDEVMSFYDEHLKGAAPQTDYPNFAIQSSTGTWRSQDSWPGNAHTSNIELTGGAYLDDGLAGSPNNSFLQSSEPLARDTRVTGTPRITLPTEGHGNVMAKLYDVAPDGNAVMFDQQVSLVRPGTTAFEFRSTDWLLPAGHSLGVEIGTIQPGYSPDTDWIDTPSGEQIAVGAPRLELATGNPADDKPLVGGRSPWLDTYLTISTKPLQVGTPSFRIPEH